MTAKIRRISLHSLRIILGILFLLSGIGKLINSGDARHLVELMATNFYWLIEYKVPIVLGFTALELLLAVWLLWGKKLRWSLSIALILILGFTGVLSYFYVMGFTVASCGCFGAIDVGGGLTFGLIKDVIFIILIVAALYLTQSNRSKQFFSARQTV